MTLLSERRRVPPYGLAGGGPGARGRDWLVHGGRRRRLPAKDDAASAGRGSALRRDAGRRGVRNRPASRAQGQAACQAALRDALDAALELVHAALQLGHFLRARESGAGSPPDRRIPRGSPRRAPARARSAPAGHAPPWWPACERRRPGRRGRRLASADASLRSWVTSFRPSVWTRFTEARTSSSDRRAARVSAINTTPPWGVAGTVGRLENYYALRQCQASVDDPCIFQYLATLPRTPRGGRIAQLVRAPASHAGGPWFESTCDHFSPWSPHDRAPPGAKGLRTWRRRRSAPSTRVSLDIAAGRVRVGGGPERVGQEHAAPPAGRSRSADVGRDRDRRHAHLGA